MDRYAVDPFIVTLPSKHHPSPERWVHALAGWLKAVDEGSEYGWVHFMPCTMGLIESQRYPDFSSLRALVNRCDIDVDAGWVSRHLSRFFQDPAKAISAQCSIKAVLPEEAPAIAPAQFVTRNDSVASSLVDDLLVLGCECDWHQSRTAIVSVPFDEAVSKVTLNASIAMTNPPNARPSGSPPTINVEFPVVFTPDDITSVLEPRRLFSVGARAIRQEMVRRASARARHDLVVGHQFLTSLWDSGIVTEATASLKLLRAGASLICGDSAALGFDVRAIRENSSPNAKQLARRRDGAKGWRMTITKHGAGWRLQYWHSTRADGREVFELANVVSEKDVAIPE